MARVTRIELFSKRRVAESSCLTARRLRRRSLSADGDDLPAAGLTVAGYDVTSLRPVPLSPAPPRLGFARSAMNNAG